MYFLMLLVLIEGHPYLKKTQKTKAYFCPLDFSLEFNFLWYLLQKEHNNLAFDLLKYFLF